MRVAVCTFGCRQNQSESEAMAVLTRQAGHVPVAAGEPADVYVINTCTVTHEADADARQLIRHFHRENPEARIVVTGCYAQIAAQELAALPGVTRVIGNAEKGRIAEFLSPGEGVPAEITVSDISGVKRFDPLPPTVDTERSRPHLKVQDGCNYRCAFCIIPETRGPNRSALPEKLLRDFAALAAAGYPEVVLTGTHLGTYGRDLTPPTSLAVLVRELLELQTGVRVRVSSIDPHEVREDFFSLFRESPTLCRHLHLPLQSGHDRILRLMRRGYTAEDFSTLVHRLSAAVPGIALGTDVIVGFPGEGEEEFAATYDLLASLPLAALHVFSYSRRSGTPAASFPNQVDKRTKAVRSRTLRTLSQKKSLAFRKKCEGHELEVVVLGERERETGWLQGMSDNYITVLFAGGDTLRGRLARVRLEQVTPFSTLGRLVCT